MITKENRKIYTIVISILTIIFLILFVGFTFRLLNSENQYIILNIILFTIFMVLFLTSLAFWFWISKCYKCFQTPIEIETKTEKKERKRLEKYEKKGKF